MPTEGIHSCREVNTGPTNADIVALLSNIQLKLSGMDKRLETLESLEKKVDGVDK